MSKRYPKNRPTVVDFFCGAGGMSLGFEQAGFDVVLGVDRDGHHVATHERNFPLGESLCCSVTDLSGEQVKEITGLEEFDVVVGGAPCQGFSHMGLRDLEDPRSSLVFHFARLIVELRPKIFALENVPGMASGKTRPVLDEFIRKMTEGGYDVVSPVQVLDAVDFGVPQRRRRLFVIGSRRDLELDLAYPSGICKGQPERPTVWEAISDLPTVEREDRLFKENDTRFRKKPKSEYASVARGIKADPSDLSIPREWDAGRCTGCLRTNHAQSSIDLYSATPPGETVPGHKLPRLDPKGVAPTLRAGSDSTHGSYTAPRPVHPVEPRCITSREAARLHGYPDWFSFYPLKWHAYRQIGNSVAPPVARAIGAELIRALGVPLNSPAPKPITLGDEFALPEDRPRTLKRIPIMGQFPQVLEALLETAINGEQLVKPRFTFDDVKRAIKQSGVDLHWVRAGTFLPEIARSRRVNDILHVVEAKGYTIRSIDEGDYIGEFVPSGTAGAIDDRDAIHVRIDEIHNASKLKMWVKIDANAHSAMSLFEDAIVLEEIWGSSKAIVEWKQGVQRSNGATTLEVRKTSRSKRKPTALVVSRTSALPQKSRLHRIASERDCDEVILVISATSKHVVVVRYEDCGNYPREVVRKAFELKGQ